MQRTFAGVALAILLTACSEVTPRDGSVVASGSDPIATPAGAATGAAIGAPTGDDSAAVAQPGSNTAAAAAFSASAGSEPSGSAGGDDAAPAAAQATPSGSTVGVSDDAIVVSVLAGFSGPYGGLFKTWADNAFGLWAAEINDRGGIHGRKIVLKQVDNRDTAEGGVAACKQVQGNGSFLAISMAGLGGADISSSDCLDKAKIAVVAFNLAAYRESWRYVVDANGDAKQAVPIASFIKTVIGDGDGKTGMIVVNDPIHFAARDAISSELDRLGMTHVRDETVSVNQGSFVAELSRLRSAGATTVVLVTGGEAIGIVRDAKAMGYAPNFTGLFWTADEFSQAAGELWKGIKAVRVFPTSESAMYAEYKKKAQQYGFDSVSGTTVMAYYGAGLLISDTIAKVGPALGRDGFVTAAGQLGEYDNGILALSFPRDGLAADVKAFPVVCCNADNTWKGLGAPRLRFE